VNKTIEGVIGLIMDVTELKARERDIEAQEREKRRLVANEAAAKEASRLKSQFLANVSQPYHILSTDLLYTNIVHRCHTRFAHPSQESWEWPNCY